MMLFLGAGGYVGGFVAHAHKVKGVPLSKEALPHPEFWLQLKSLVMDGASLQCPCSFLLPFLFDPPVGRTCFVTGVEFTKLRLREQQGYATVPSVPEDSGEDSKKADVKEPPKAPGAGMVEERDESVHPSKAPIRVVVKPLGAQEAGGASSEDEELGK